VSAEEEADHPEPPSADFPCTGHGDRMARSSARNGISFFRISLGFSAVSACLASVYLVYPHLMFWLFGMPSQSGALVMARRGGALFLGIAILLYRIRSTDDRNTRIAVSTGLATSCAALAALGIVDLIAGHVKAGILIAVVAETVCAIGYLAVLIEEPRRYQLAARIGDRTEGQQNPTA